MGEQRSWNQARRRSSDLSRQRLRAGLSLPVQVFGGAIGDYVENRGDHPHHHRNYLGSQSVGGGDDEDEDGGDEVVEEEDQEGDKSKTQQHLYLSRQTRLPYPHYRRNQTIGHTHRSRSQSPCSITSESAESQGDCEKALDPPRLSIPNGGVGAAGNNGGAGAALLGVGGGGLIGGGYSNNGRKLSVLFSSHDAWNEEHIVQSFKELNNPTATSVFEAAWSGNLLGLTEILDDEENLNRLREDGWRDNEGRTPLHLASACGHVPCVELLLAKGAEVNSCDSNEKATPLSCAASCGSVAVLEVLLAHGADVNAGYENGKTSLHWAVQACSVDCAKRLLDAGAKQNPPTCYSETPLHVAAALGDPVCLQLLLDYGADVNLCKGSNRSTALHLSAEEGSAACLKLLLKAGASHSAQDIRGHTALHVAATCDADAVIALLKAGADPNAVDANGRIPLHCAVARGSRAAECVRLLVESGADIDAQDNYGYTPLHLSAVNESSQCAKILLHHGSDVTLKQVIFYLAFCSLLPLLIRWELYIFYISVYLHVARTNAGTNALSLLVRRIPDVMAFLVDRLDSAVTIHDHDPGDPDCEVRLDFRAIVPNCERRLSGKGKNNQDVTSSTGGGSSGGGGGGGKDYFKKPHKETEFLTCLLAAGNKKILAHPLSEAFLTLKWQRVRKFFWASLLFQIALVALFTIYVVEVYLIRCPYRRPGVSEPFQYNLDQGRSDILEIVPDEPPPLPPASSLGKPPNNTLPTLLLIKPNSHNLTKRDADISFSWFGFVPLKKKTKESDSSKMKLESRHISGGPQPQTTTKRPRGRENSKITPPPGYYHPVAGLPTTAEPEEESSARMEPIQCHFTPTLQVIWILLVVFCSLMAIKEIFQLVQSPLSYVVSSENWGQWLLISSVVITAWSSPELQFELAYWQYPAAACGIFLAWGLMLLQVGRFPALGLYVQMLGKVAANFGLFILAYACLLIAFALAFCVLFPEHPPYSSVALSILKVFTMMVGEVDYEDLFYSPKRVEDPILFPLTCKYGQVFRGDAYGGALVVRYDLSRMLFLAIGTFLFKLPGSSEGSKVESSITSNSLDITTGVLYLLEASSASIAKHCGFAFAKKRLARAFSLQHHAISYTIFPDFTFSWSYYFRPNDPRDKRLPKDIKLASLRLAASRHSSSKKSHGHSQHADNNTRPVSSVSHHNSVLLQHPEIAVRRIEQRLDHLQTQLNKAMKNMNGQMDAILTYLREQQPQERKESDNDNVFLEGYAQGKSPSASPSPSVGFKKPSFSTSPAIIKDASCEKG
ncbi:Transient receptor potential channel pyrexia [Orchesella cincta]|uniref:Transient receptor potential channel pyrexia n=1 Tax=Orchesella cincta TaxID=48709 RepID=A0A1D2N000_ORCCI|nr:Transient receptor potential channel pyrexia [Orchesella cincta]